MAEIPLQTERLVLRDWRDADAVPMQAICSDPLVMATLGPPLDMAETKALLAWLQDSAARDGHTFWALERREDQRLIGFCGVRRGAIAPIEGQLEIGWRLGSGWWGQSYAREAAQATLGWIAANRPGESVCAITAQGNTRSRGLMERLRMSYCPGADFDHPAVPDGSPLKRHVVYRLEIAA